MRRKQLRHCSITGKKIGKKIYYLEQIINLSDSGCFSFVDFFNHLPSDGLQAWQGQEDGSETASAVVLTVTDVILQIDLENIFSLVLHF